jgi:L-tryptophan--pyruvate aminotransferase
MYEQFWRQMGDKTTIIIPGWQSLSYFSDPTSICWFLEPEFAKEVVRLHNVVGNAVTQVRHVVVGTGSSQLILAALYALSSPHASQPITVVSAVPYYSVSHCVYSVYHVSLFHNVYVIIHMQVATAMPLLFLCHFLI